VELERKFVPLMVSICAAAPAVAVAGERLVMLGTGFVAVTEKFTVFEAPPPGTGFVTTTAYVPAVAWSLALSWMVSCPEFTYVAVCATPL
jgi:hypothetical protein